MTRVTATHWSKADACYLEVKRPAVVRMYNTSMGGVDKTDFLVALYRTKTQSEKWTLTMIFHIITAWVVNAWLEYRRDGAARGLVPASQLDLLDFTLRIVKAHAWVESLPKAKKRGRPSLSPLQPSKNAKYAQNRPMQDVRYDEVGHCPIRSDSREQRCKLEGCTGQTHIMCVKCNAHVCLANFEPSICTNDKICP